MEEETRVGSTVLLWFLALWGAGGVWVGTIQVQVLGLTKKLDEKGAEDKTADGDVNKQFQMLSVTLNLIQSQIQDVRLEMAKDYATKEELDRASSRVITQLEAVGERLAEVTIQMARISIPAVRGGSRAKSRSK